MNGILTDWQIQEDITIKPFAQGSPKGAISYGLTSMGYDLRLGTEFVRYLGGYSRLDPKAINPEQVERFTRAEPFEIQPGESLLGTSVEWVSMPQDVLGICQGKSTWARCFILVPPTPIEPGFQGNITLEITNLAPVPVMLYPNEGICQLVFFRSVHLPYLDYAQKGGIYQGQTGVTLPRVRGLSDDIR